MPEMSYVSKGKLRFLTRHVDKKEWEKPFQALLTSTIHVGNVRKTLKPHSTLVNNVHNWLFNDKRRTY
jgi:hypothetical protein